MFFICHVTWCVHVTKELCDFLGKIFSSEATSLSSLVAIGLLELEIKYSSFVMWSTGHVTKEAHDFVEGRRSP